jgi:hypothetical protein
MTDATFTDPGQARTYAVLNGLDFDNQDNYCGACRAYHVGVTHDVAVPEQCGDTHISGFSAVNDCQREAGHPPDVHRDINGTLWSARCPAE